MLSGFKLPEAIGFGILGATIGAVVCNSGLGDLAAHTALGVLAGAAVFIGLAQVPVRRAASLLARVRPIARSD